MKNVKGNNLNKKKSILMLNNTKGITLIALVITIIVLIILAGVSISLVLGENGIINKAKEGKQNTEQAKVEEETMLNEAAEYMENLTPKVDANGVEPGKSGYLGSGYYDPYIPVGFEHIGTENWNSGYQIKETATGNIFVWVPCVLDQSKVKEGDTVVTFGKTVPSTTEKTDPYYMYNKNNLGLIPTDATVAEEDSTVSDIETSVGTYGGFYIAKYEAGIEGATDNGSLTTKTATDGSVKPLSKAGVGVWDNISRVNALAVSKAMIDNASTGAKSTLISGAAWDTTLKWITATADSTYATNSAGKGWYKDVSNNTIHVTGYYGTNTNNIFDMAGNVYEWTSENCTYSGYFCAVLRGGYCNGSGSESPAAGRVGDNETSAYSGYAFRPVLYK